VNPGSTHLVTAMTPVAAARAIFPCSLCSHAAGAVEFAPPRLAVTGFGAGQTVEVQAPVSADVATAVGAADPETLFELAPLSVPFYCPDCRRVFCSHHWVSLPLLDDHALGGTYATCPEGHTRLIGPPEGEEP
jgi:hypothetical protein